MSTLPLSFYQLLSKMVLLIDECARILECKVADLRDMLNHPSSRSKIVKELTGKKLRTTYDDRNGMIKNFFFDGLTRKGADCTNAYGRLPRPFNVPVAAHFYARHRIRLQNPYLHCVIEKFPNGAEERYYPLELVELVDELPFKMFANNLFKDMSKPSSTASTSTYKDAWGHDELSQCFDDDGW
jgi:hypothetical protein